MASGKHFSFWWIVYITYFLYTCAAHTSSQGQPGQALRDLLGADITATYNTSQTYILYQQTETPDRIGLPIRFAVVRVADQHIVYQGSYQRGHVRWHGDDALEVLNPPDKRRPDEDLNRYTHIIPIQQTINSSDL